MRFLSIPQRLSHVGLYDTMYIDRQCKHRLAINHSTPHPFRTFAAVIFTDVSDSRGHRGQPPALSRDSHGHPQTGGNSGERIKKRSAGPGRKNRAGEKAKHPIPYIEISESIHCRTCPRWMPAGCLLYHRGGRSWPIYGCLA